MAQFIYNDWLRIRRTSSPLWLACLLLLFGGIGVIGRNGLKAGWDSSQYLSLLIMGAVLGRFATRSPELRFLRLYPLPVSVLGVVSGLQVAYVLSVIAVVPYIAGLLASPMPMEARLLRCCLFLAASLASAFGFSWAWSLAPVASEDGSTAISLEGLFRRVQPIVSLEVSLLVRLPVHGLITLSGFLMWCAWPFATSFINALVIANSLFLLTLQRSYASLNATRGPLLYRLAGLSIRNWLWVRVGLLATLATVQLAGYLVGLRLGGPEIAAEDWPLLLMFGVITCFCGPAAGTSVAALGWTSRHSLVHSLAHAFALLASWLLGWLGLALSAVLEADSGWPASYVFTALLVMVGAAMIHLAGRRLERVAPA